MVSDLGFLCLGVWGERVCKGLGPLRVSQGQV